MVTDQPRQAPSHSAAPRKPRVLIADDNVDVLNTMEFLLRDEGYDVATAKDGDQAAIALAEFDPDIVVADIKMPRRSGWELAKLVKKIDEDSGRKRLLIAVSGHFKNSSD